MSRCDPCKPEKTTGLTPQEAIQNPRYVGDGQHYQKNQGPLTGGEGMLAGFARRIAHIKQEQRDVKHATKLQRNGNLATQVLCIYAQLKTADAFWQPLLKQQLDTLFSIYERRIDYDNSDSHKTNCKQLAIARQRAGFDVHPAWREYANNAHTSDGGE